MVLSIVRVKEYLKQFKADTRVLELETSSATVELAAQALGVIPARIAKTLSFLVGSECLVLVIAGDAKIDNSKYKKLFGAKAKMLTPQEVQDFLGYPIGGVCPFDLNKSIPICLDISLKRFETVFPACGTPNSAIRLTCAELEEFSGAVRWVDVCKDWDPDLKE